MNKANAREGLEEVSFANEQLCDGCGEGPTRVFYGESRGDDLFLCRRCATERYCEEHHEVFDSERGLEIHKGRVH